jgi:hypothetical protein
MIWILGFIGALVAGVLITNLVLSTDAPQRKTRPPLKWRKAPRELRRSHAGAVGSSLSSSSASSFNVDALTLFAAADYVHSSSSAHDSSSACDTDSDPSGDSGDCGSDGGSFD